MILEKLDKVRKWVLGNKDSERLVDPPELANATKEYGLKPIEMVSKLKEEGLVTDSPKMGKWSVTK